MNITNLHSYLKSVSLVDLLNSDGAKATALQIMRGGTLKAHTSEVPALLVCVVGEALFEDENGASVILKPGDYVRIVPMVQHWVKGTITSHPILVK